MPCCNSCADGKECDSTNLKKISAPDLLKVGLGLITLDLWSDFASSALQDKVLFGAGGYVGTKLLLKNKMLHKPLEKITDNKHLLVFETVYTAMRMMSYERRPSLFGAVAAAFLIAYMNKKDEKKKGQAIANTGNVHRLGPRQEAYMHYSAPKESARRGLRTFANFL